MKIKKISEQNREWIHALLCKRWGSAMVVTRGSLHHADQLPGFIAYEAEKPVGLITYNFDKSNCEIISVDSLHPGKGIGSLLIKSVIDIAVAKGCKRVWLITTNDNTNALRFYQKIGFQLVALHKGAIKRSRELKPEIPETGNDGIPIRDEIELEIFIQ